jgi:hypothetical protein
MSIVDRIELIINNLDISTRNFEANIGVAYGTVQKPITNNKTVGSDVLSKILITYPELSAEWLMRGEGEMLINVDNSTKNAVNSNNINNGNSNINGDFTLNTNVEHNTLVEEVGFLRGQLVEKDNQLKEKDNQLKEKYSLISKLLDKIK